MVRRKPKHSVDDACAHAVNAAALAPRFHFACQQSDNRMERYTNAKLADMHTYGGADCNERVAQWFSANLSSFRALSVEDLHVPLSTGGSKFITKNWLSVGYPGSFKSLRAPGCPPQAPNE
ncbi:hypothetical protein TNCV_329611 [Trichonephila clavipes]|nr:hypothetical protein TNCV_329611 [Trichonephila clavipes]